MSEQAKALKVKFEAMDEATLKVEADSRSIRGRHLIKNRATFVEKLVAHDMQVAAIDPGAVEAGAPPERGDGKRQVPSAQEKSIRDTEAKRGLPAVKLPPEKPAPEPAPPPPPGMQVQAGQQYVVRKDFPVNLGGLMTTLAKGSVVTTRTHSQLQVFVSRGLRLRRIDGANHGLDRLGVQQVTTVYGGDDEDVDEDDVPENGVDMRAFLQMTNDMSRLHTKIATLETQLEAALADALAAKALLDEAP